MIALIIVIGFLRDWYGGTSFPSPVTIFLVIAVSAGIAWLEISRGARALSLSASGITLERALGGKVLRLTWSDIRQVEVQNSLLGQVWTFHLKSGRTVRWTQSDFDGDQRIELGRALRNALAEHHIRLG